MIAAPLQDIDKKVQILVLITGTLEDGSPHWAYASIPVTRYELFKQAEKAGHYDLGDFGRILTHGKGSMPDAAVIQQMKDQYGADSVFEEELEGMLAQVDKVLKLD